MKTPALRKDTVWYQILLLVAGVIAVLQDSEYVLGLLGENVGVLMIASSIVAIGLSFTKSRGPVKSNLDILDETDWDEE